MSKKDEEILGAYASGVEDTHEVINDEPKEMTMPNERMTTSDGRPIPQSILELRRDAMNPYADSNEVNYKNNLGWIKIPVNTLPTHGMFYPEDTEVLIRAARGEEVKHWSTMNEQDITELSRTDDILNYIIERCVSLKSVSHPQMSWKDVKEGDKLYLLTSVQEFTFPNNENKLMVPIAEGKDVPLQKEMVDYIKFPEELMKFYSSEERCFVFNLRNINKTIRMYIPSIGSNSWIKSYIQAKTNAREQFDADFAIYAPLLISDFRRLSQRLYEDMVSESRTWSVEEWSLISQVMRMLNDSSAPKFKYTDESGQEVQIPLTFRGGIKALFTIPDTLSKLC